MRKCGCFGVVWGGCWDGGEFIFPYVLCNDVWVLGVVIANGDNGRVTPSYPPPRKLE